MSSAIGQMAMEAGTSRSSQPLCATPKMSWDQAREVGARRQTLNFAVVALVGAFLLGIGYRIEHGFGRFWLGLAVGLIYANAFEYVYHRYLLHSFQSVLAVGHARHHSHWGTDDEPAHVGFGTSPFWVMAILVINSFPFLLAGYLFRWSVVPGVVFAFHIYFVMLESIHWRIHVGRLPKWMGWCRHYHFTHHAGGETRFNVFLPLFDLLLGTYKLPATVNKMSVRYRWQLLHGGGQHYSPALQPKSKVA